MTESENTSRGFIQKWNAIPLYLRIVIAMIAGVVGGLALGERAKVMEIPSQVVLQLLGALAPPLILVAVTHVLMTTEIRGKMALRLCGLLIINTTVAIMIGLAVANIMQPGRWSELELPQVQETDSERLSPVELLVQNVPHSILGPLGDKQNIIGVILIAVAFGMALRGVKEKRLDTVENMVEVAYQVLLTVLHWIIHLVPIGVFAIVARVVGVQGFSPFAAMGVFVLAVLLALLLQFEALICTERSLSSPLKKRSLRGLNVMIAGGWSGES